MSSIGPVDVAVGVVVRPDGAVLLGQRPPGKPYAGWWEFPGGKLESGESVHQALVRELDEELGLHILASCPWVVRQFVYPHATVRLHFRRVFDFEGHPRGREGQAFAWRVPGAIDVAPLLPATVPVIGWLALPPVCARSSASALGVDAFLRALERRAREGALGMLVLDEPGLPAAAFEALFYAVSPICRAHGVRMLVGASHAESFQRAAGGLLLDEPTLMALASRPGLPFVAAEVSTPAGVARASALGLECILALPLHASSCHAAGVATSEAAACPPGTVAPGGALAACIAETGLPAYAAADWGLNAFEAMCDGAHGLVHGPVFWEE